jgi:[citrate (pro-3S)-lyase] ligase
MNWPGYVKRPVNLGKAAEVGRIRDFLARFALSFDGQVAYTVGIYQDERLVATGSLDGEVLRNIAVEPSLRGEGLTAEVVSHLIQEAGRRGVYHYFIYTKPQTRAHFLSLGFKEIACAEPYAALLECGLGCIADYRATLSERVSHLPEGPRGAVIVNCNPFTLGHRSVIARAAADNAAVVVQVVEEDRSLFPFADRFRLVTEAVRDLPNVVVLPGGKYVISAATFPAYFTRGQDSVLAQTRLDADLFGRHIAPALGVTRRYVGSEPYCPVTATYNGALTAVLPAYGVDVVVVPRAEMGSAPISASRVRDLIRQDGWDDIARMVPDVTYRYLRAPETRAVIDRIKATSSRH